MTGGRRAIGSTLIVDAHWATNDPFNHPVVTADATTARLPLSGPAVLLTALAPDLIALRHRLRTSLAELEAVTHDSDHHGDTDRERPAGVSRVQSSSSPPS